VGGDVQGDENEERENTWGGEPRRGIVGVRDDDVGRRLGFTWWPWGEDSEEEGLVRLEK